jgi:hypothetical protein
MAHFVLDKNPQQEYDENLSELMKITELAPLNSILYSDPFLKTYFLNKLILKTNTPIIYLDFDLLYSGYVVSNIISLPPGLTLYRPTKNEWIQTIKTILLHISEQKSILIIDSLNGFFNLNREKKDAGRLINSFIMLLLCVGNMSKSNILLCSMSRKRMDEGWVLSITGRHVLDTNHMTKIHLDYLDSKIIANILNEKDNPKKSFKIPIQSELF